MEYLECDRCAHRYLDQASIDLSKREAEAWMEDCRRDGVEPRGLIGCPDMTCEGELVLKVARRPRPNSQEEVLQTYPRLVAHLICGSLGYFTPAAAANAVLHYIQGEPNWCEWYTHMARGWDRGKLLQVGRDALVSAVRGRHHHQGYMSEYRQARELVEQVRQGGQGPVFASWF
jgi:hypothetical protein